MNATQLPLPARPAPINPDTYTFQGYSVHPKQSAREQVAYAVNDYRRRHPNAEIEVWSRTEVPVPEGIELVISARAPKDVILLGGK